MFQHQNHQGCSFPNLLSGDGVIVMAISMRFSRVCLKKMETSVCCHLLHFIFWDIVRETVISRTTSNESTMQNNLDFLFRAPTVGLALCLPPPPVGPAFRPFWRVLIVYGIRRDAAIIERLLMRVLAPTWTR
jgi:hypothetical protein